MPAIFTAQTRHGSACRDHKHRSHMQIIMHKVHHGHTRRLKIHKTMYVCKLKTMNHKQYTTRTPEVDNIHIKQNKTQTRTNARAHTHTVTHTNARAHTHTESHTYKRSRTRTHSHTHTNARAHTHTQMLVRTHTHKCTHSLFVVRYALLHVSRSHVRLRSYNQRLIHIRVRM